MCCCNHQTILWVCAENVVANNAVDLMKVLNVVFCFGLQVPALLPRCWPLCPAGGSCGWVFPSANCGMLSNIHSCIHLIYVFDVDVWCLCADVQSLCAGHVWYPYSDGKVSQTHSQLPGDQRRGSLQVCVCVCAINSWIMVLRHTQCNEYVCVPALSLPG